eukprot:7231256-Alexandrium_andersonii.AAC.1
MEPKRKANYEARAGYRKSVSEVSLAEQVHKGVGNVQNLKGKVAAETLERPPLQMSACQLQQEDLL